jgi:hypothetical protein
MGIAIAVTVLVGLASASPYAWHRYKWYRHRKLTQLGSKTWGYASFEQFLAVSKLPGSNVIWGEHHTPVLKVNGKGMVIVYKDYQKLLEYFKDDGRNPGYHKDCWK